jgi:hypothetical protein
MTATQNIAIQRGASEASPPLARVIRKDHNPFAFLEILQFIRWTDHSCPKCGYLFRRTYFPGAVLLGEGQSVCRRCGALFDDSSREWPELRMSEKMRFLLPPGVLGIAGGVILCGLIAIFVAPHDRLNWSAVALILTVTVGIATLPAIAWCLIRMPAIRRSIERYEAGAAAIQKRFGAGH